VKIARQRKVRFGRPPKLTPNLIRQVLLSRIAEAGPRM